MSTRNGASPTAYPPASAIPASLDSETAVLGSCLLNPDAIHEVSAIVQPTDFFRERNAWIYEAMLALNERRDPVDFVLLQEELERTGRLAEVTPAYLTGLLSATPTAFYAAHYAKAVAVTALRRRLIAAGGEIAKIGYDESNDPETLLDIAQELLFAVGAQRGGKMLEHISVVTRRVIDYLGVIATEGKPPGVPCGFRDIDNLLGGFQRGDMITLAARPSMGKSAAAFAFALNAARIVGARVAIFSLEMSDSQAAERWLASLSRIDSTRLRLGKIDDHEWVALSEAANDLSRQRIWIDDSPGLTITDIRTRARRRWAEEGLDLLIVDYMQLMRSVERGENNHLEVSAISKGLKALARELNVPVIALSQLSRGVESRADKRPMLSDLRASGAIEEDSDVVMFIYREEYYIPDTDRAGIADFIVAKHRNGATGTASLFFRKELTTFHDLDITRTELNHD